MSPYATLLVLHLFAAITFAGAVFFEVLILGGLHGHVPEPTLHAIEAGIGRRARRIMPWVLLLLYGSGIGMAWHYRALLAHPFDSGFAFMLTVKIVLALSVFGHFLTAMHVRARGARASAIFRRIHLSVFCHLIGIIVLAKLMFHLRW